MARRQPRKDAGWLDTNGYISIDSLQDDGTWVAHARSSDPAPAGSAFHSHQRRQQRRPRVQRTEVHLLEPEAPTMYFRYIESPDGVFQYPLFASEEEADYDKIAGYRDRPRTRTRLLTTPQADLYMPDHLGVMDGTEAPTGQTFDGQPIIYTEITSLPTPTSPRLHSATLT